VIFLTSDLSPMANPIGDKYTRIILETAVRDGKLMQDLELESLCNGVGHSQMVKDHPIANDSGSRDCVKLPSPTAVSRIILETAVGDSNCRF